jgi:hypothetical protein
MDLLFITNLEFYFNPQIILLSYKFAFKNIDMPIFQGIIRIYY